MARTADDFIQGVPTRTGLVGALCRLSYTIPTIDDRFTLRDWTQVEPRLFDLQIRSILLPELAQTSKPSLSVLLIGCACLMIRVSLCRGFDDCRSGHRHCCARFKPLGLAQKPVSHHRCKFHKMSTAVEGARIVGAFQYAKIDD